MVRTATLTSRRGGRSETLGALMNEYWYVTLPSGARLRGEDARTAINRELSELVQRGWEPVSMATEHPTLMVAVLLKKAAS